MRIIAIQLTGGGDKQVFDDLDDALTEIREWWEEGAEEGLVVRLAEMSPEEYAALPEFDGY